MEFVEQVRAKLSAAQLQVLSDAVEQVDDFLLAEIVTLYHDSGPAAVARSFSDLFLPGRYVDFYDFTMLRRLYACLLVIAGRLQDRWEPARCRGEELVLRAVLDHAETCCEEVTGESTEAFADLREWLFEDLDHEYVFAPAFDGIDDPDSYEGSRLGVASLDPSAWFDAFPGADAVHPMIQ